MRNECNIIRDLLPLYAEDMVSADTADFVEAHLAACAACRAELEALRQPKIPEAASAEPADESFSAFMRRWGRRLRWLWRTISVLLGGLAVLAFVGVLTVKGSGFLDLSGIARAVLGTITALCTTGALIAWRTDHPRARWIKLAVWLLAVVVIIAGALIAGYDPPAVEIVNR